MPTIIIFVLMIGAIWFMQRTQKKQAQERQNQLSAAKKGDKIVTIGGLYGVIDEVDTDAKTVVIDVDGVYLTFELGAIKRVIPTAVAEEPVEEVAAVETSNEQEESAIEEN